MMENVKTENRDGILIVTIDRPKVLNALNAQTVEEIGQAFAEARDDDAVKAVIVTGGGEKAFVAGDGDGAAEAEKIGVVNRVVPAEELMTAAIELARKIASRGPLAVRAAIEAVMSGSEMPSDEGQVLEATLFGLLASSEDMQEGMAAFLEKRQANFSGR